MLKSLAFLLCAYLVSAADTCRREVAVSPTSTCGVQQTIYNEGECLCCYYNTKNIPTIGIGYSLDLPNSAQVLSKYNLTLADVLQDCTDKTTKHCLTPAQAEDIFKTVSYPEAEQCADSYFPGLPPAVRAAIVDIAVTDCGALNGLVKMNAALQRRDWKMVATELRSSAWCRQSGPTRCNSNSMCIESANLSGSCKGEVCGNYVSKCSPNPECICYQTSDKSSFCGVTDSCTQYTNCDSCSPKTSVCLVNTCCGAPLCVPLSTGQNCTNPPTEHALNWNKARRPKLLACNGNHDCPLGKVCQLHTIGSFCV